MRSSGQYDIDVQPALDALNEFAEAIQVIPMIFLSAYRGMGEALLSIVEVESNERQ